MRIHSVEPKPQSEDTVAAGQAKLLGLVRCLLIGTERLLISVYDVFSLQGIIVYILIAEKSTDNYLINNNKTYSSLCLCYMREQTNLLSGC